MSETGAGEAAQTSSTGTYPPESPQQRVARKWSELLQELRVAQMGVQILTGFLLTVPFSSRFGELSTFTRNAYLVTVSLAILSAVMLIAPVAFHRVLYGRSEKGWLVEAAAQVSRAGLGCLGLTLVAVVFIVFQVVSGTTAAVVAGGVTIVLVTGLWLVTPWAARGGPHDHHEHS